MTVCCNRQISVTVSRTVFPQTRLYINGKKISEQAQDKLGDVVVSGGRNLNDDGHGNLAPSGPALIWNGNV
jgi:hypothetical protein